MIHADFAESGGTPGQYGLSFIVNNTYNTKNLAETCQHENQDLIATCAAFAHLDLIETFIDSADLIELKLFRSHGNLSRLIGLNN